MRYFLVLHILISVVLYPTIFQVKTAKALTNKEFVTVYSSNLYGESEPCG